MYVLITMSKQTTLLELKMKRNLIGYLSVGIVSLALMACGGGGGGSSGSSGGTPIDTKFTIASPVMSDGGQLPLEHACKRDGGQALPPAFYWKNAPADTGSFILSIERVSKYTVNGVEVTDYIPYRTLYNIDGGVLSTPATFDLTGLGGNILEKDYWGQDPNAGGVPCHLADVLPPPYRVQEYRVTLLAISKNLVPITVIPNGTPVDTVAPKTQYNHGIVDYWVNDSTKVGQGQFELNTLILGRTSMTFKY